MAATQSDFVSDADGARRFGGRTVDLDDASLAQLLRLRAPQDQPARFKKEIKTHEKSDE